MVGGLVKGLKVFDKYPKAIQDDLGRILYCDVFEDGRLVSKQGRPKKSTLILLREMNAI